MLGCFVNPFESSRVVFSTNNAIKIKTPDVVFGAGTASFSGYEVVFEGATTTSTSTKTIVKGSPQPFVSHHMAQGGGSLE